MASDYTSKFSEKYGQLSGADLEILGAREQAATARALRTAFKPAQGQMVGGWYVKPALTQHLADALMQYNNYKNEQAGTAKAQELIDARKLATKTNALAQAKLSTDEAQPAYDREVTPARQDVIPAVESGTTNSLVDEALAAGYGTNEQGQPLFDAAPTPSAAPIDRSQALLDKSIQMQAQAKADADAAIPLTSILNQYFPELSKATLGNAVRTAPLDNVGASINNQTPIPAEGTSQASQVTPAPQEQTLPTITTPAPMEAPAQPNRLAQMLRGEGDYAPIQKASVRDIPAVTERMPAVKGYNEGEWLKQQQALIANDQFHAADAVGAYIKERKVAETARSVAQMADLKVQREGILNREQARAIATERIEDNAIRERQRAADKKEAAASLQAFTKAEHALNRTLTSEESKNRREDRQTARDQAQLGRLGRDERYVQDENGKPTGKTEIIPGTTTWMKAKSDSSGEFQSLTAVNRGADKLRKDIKSILTDSGFEKSFGQIAGRTPDSAADVQRVANLFRSIEGQLQARGLGINKQENGSIGAMAVAEWEKMASLLAVVKRTDSPEAARNAYKGALDILDGVTSAASQKYQNEWGGGQFDLSKGKSSAPSGGVKKYNLDTGKIE